MPVKLNNHAKIEGKTPTHYSISKYGKFADTEECIKTWNKEVLKVDNIKYLTGELKDIKWTESDWKIKGAEIRKS